MEVKINGIYKHFKGMIVKVMAIAKHSETLEEMVIYEHDGEIWVRPYDMFLEKVDKEKYPDIEQEYRFELQEIKDK